MIKNSKSEEEKKEGTEGKSSADQKIEHNSSDSDEELEELSTDLLELLGGDRSYESEKDLREALDEAGVGDLRIVLVEGKPYKATPGHQHNKFTTNKRGKTNKNHKVFSRSVRHKDVLMCGFGALGFYLYYRFFHTKEFEENTPDFTVPSEWWDIKTLVNINDRESFLKGVSDVNYAKFMKKCLEALGLPTNFLLHLGRKLGSIELELKELSVALVKLMGNWDLTVFDKNYSCKLPLEALRVAADFVDGIFFCPRSNVNTANLAELEESFWPWVELSLAYIEEEFASDKGNKDLFTAFAWLSFMKRLKRVI